MSTSSKKTARASLIVVLGAASVIPTVAALQSDNPSPNVVVAAPSSAEATQQLTDEILGRATPEATAYAQDDRRDSGASAETTDIQQQALDAYFDAGYDYDHAVELANYWGYGDDAYTAKITKGKFILGLIDFPPPAEDHTPDIQQQALDAYFDAGYDYDHAVELANYWGSPDPYTAKITKGKFILGLIDFPPPAEDHTPDIQQQALDAYFDAGYDYDHAVELANYWGSPDPYTAKITKGKFILGLIDFPPPAEDHTPDIQQQALDAYFDAGYDYDHAVELANYWGYGDDAYAAKITKGKVLLGEIEFPPPAEAPAADVTDTPEV